MAFEGGCIREGILCATISKASRIVGIAARQIELTDLVRLGVILSWDVDA